MQRTEQHKNHIKKSVFWCDGTTLLIDMKRQISHLSLAFRGKPLKHPLGQMRGRLLLSLTTLPGTLGW